MAFRPFATILRALVPESVRLSVPAPFSTAKGGGPMSNGFGERASPEGSARDTTILGMSA